MDGVRLAHSATDVSHVVRCVVALRDAINGPIEVDAAWTGAQVAAMMQDSRCAVFVSSGGFIAGQLIQTVISPNVIAMEHGWYASDKSGIRLLNAFEKWADDMGATGKRMSTSYDPNSIAGRILAKRGYSPAELSWFK